MYVFSRRGSYSLTIIVSTFDIANVECRLSQYSNVNCRVSRNLDNRMLHVKWLNIPVSNVVWFNIRMSNVISLDILMSNVGWLNIRMSTVQPTSCSLIFGWYPEIQLLSLENIRHMRKEYPGQTSFYHQAKYSWLSLSRTRLSRITAYLEVEIWSLPKHETLTTGKNILWKKAKRSNFSSFPQYFQYISNRKSPVTHIFVKCGCSNYFFLNSANLICRGTDISKYFRESHGIRDNESRL